LTRPALRARDSGYPAGISPGFTVERTSRTLTGQAKVVISQAQSDGSDSAIVCETGWVDPSVRPTFEASSKNVRESVWTIQVFDEISGGPTGELPYVIHFLLSAPPQADNLRSRKLGGSFPADAPFGDGARKRDYSRCGLAATSLRIGSTLEVATSDKFIDVGEGLPQTYFLQADRYVYVRIKSLLNSTVRVTVSAKEPGNSSFAPICKIERSASELTAAGMIYGIATWDRLLRPLWRIEVSSSNATAHTPAIKANWVSVEILRQHDPERVIEKHVISNLFPDFLASCYVCKTVRRKSPGDFSSSTLGTNLSVSNPVDFLTAVSLTVPSTFTSRQNSLLEHTVEMGVAIWSAECSFCSVDTLSVLTIGDRRLIRTDLFQALQIWPAPLSTLFADKGIGGFRTIIGDDPKYTVVSDDDPTIQKLCRATETTLPVYFRRVAIAYGCQPGSKNDEKPVLHLTLEVTGGSTACGRSSNIVACEPDRELLELNGEDYSFGISGDDTWIGSGPRRVNLLHVILHEVGHWLWMWHVTGDGSIMSASLNTSRCINDADMVELGDALERRRRRRGVLRGPQAFLARKPD
jgi:hypothetical protein